MQSTMVPHTAGLEATVMRSRVQAVMSGHPVGPTEANPAGSATTHGQ